MLPSFSHHLHFVIHIFPFFLAGEHNVRVRRAGDEQDLGDHQDLHPGLHPAHPGIRGAEPVRPGGDRPGGGPDAAAR